MLQKLNLVLEKSIKKLPALLVGPQTGKQSRARSIILDEPFVECRRKSAKIMGLKFVVVSSFLLVMISCVTSRPQSADDQVSDFLKHRAYFNFYP